LSKFRKGSLRILTGLELGWGINYRCNDGQFWVFASRLSCLNPALLSSNETWVNLGIKSQKSAYRNQLNVSKQLMTSNSQKREDLRPYVNV
jgi:hypothetical protein